MVLELFSDLQSRLLWKILSEKLRHVSVAQVVHDISLKASKIDFFQFSWFCKLFYKFFSLNYFVSKTTFSGVLSLTKDQKSQNICGLVFD